MISFDYIMISHDCVTSRSLGKDRPKEGRNLYYLSRETGVSEGACLGSSEPGLNRKTIYPYLILVWKDDAQLFSSQIMNTIY